MGPQHWSIDRTIHGDPVGETVLGHSPWLQTPDLVGGLDDFLGYSYTSDVHNVEINERIRFHSFNPFSTSLGCGASAISTWPTTSP